MSPNDNQKGDQVVISYSGDIYHTAIKIWKVIPNPEKHQHTKHVYNDWKLLASTVERKGSWCWK